MNSQEKSADPDQTFKNKQLVAQRFPNTQAPQVEIVSAQEGRTTPEKANKMKAIEIIATPFKVVKYLIDTALSTVTLAIILVLAAWVFDLVPQEKVSPFLENLGDRSLELIRALGISI